MSKATLSAPREILRTLDSTRPCALSPAATVFTTLGSCVDCTLCKGSGEETRYVPTAIFTTFGNPPILRLIVDLTALRLCGTTRHAVSVGLSYSKTQHLSYMRCGFGRLCGERSSITRVIDGSLSMPGMSGVR